VDYGYYTNLLNCGESGVEENRLILRRIQEYRIPRLVSIWGGSVVEIMVEINALSAYCAVIRAVLMQMKLLARFSFHLNSHGVEVSYRVIEVLTSVYMIQAQNYRM
jgi:hypothetical protein